MTWLPVLGFVRLVRVIRAVRRPLYHQHSGARLRRVTPRRVDGPSAAAVCQVNRPDRAVCLVHLRSVVGVMFSDTVADGDARPTPAHWGQSVAQHYPGTQDPAVVLGLFALEWGAPGTPRTRSSDKNISASSSSTAGPQRSRCSTTGSHGPADHASARSSSSTTASNATGPGSSPHSPTASPTGSPRASTPSSGSSPASPTGSAPPTT